MASGHMAGKVALITGAARGTGLITATRFAEEGAAVWMGDVLTDLGETNAEALRAAGHTATFVPLDVTDPAAWTSAVTRILKAHSHIDVLVNNAAILHIESLLDTTVGDFERVLRVNLIGPFLGIQAVRDAMVNQGGGSIVNVASVDALVSHNGVAAYASSKFGVRGLTKTAAIELGEHNIRVNAVCPSGGSFDMIKPFLSKIDMGRAASAPKITVLADADDPRDELVDFAELIMFLASDAGAGCTGAEYPVDRGQTAGTVIPGMPGDPLAQGEEQR
jgi:3alpha(or 20beta)-hydroxysteroid dehydrogenase